MDAMVTARMSQAKKEAGNSVLEAIGVSPSKAINELYDYLIKQKKLPFAQEGKAAYDRKSLQEALSWVDGLALAAGNRFSSMDDEEIRVERLAARGLLHSSDQL